VNKFIHNYAIFLLGFLFILSWIPLQARESQKVQDLNSLIKKHSGMDIRLDDDGWTWKDKDVLGTLEKGEITFFDSKWLMFLIHWGPIQVAEITIDYVKARMLNMWGVIFEFTGKEGRIELAGHPAVWVEAYGTDRQFYTRFVIWNCPKSGREIIADTNYNLVLKTPSEDFETEMRSALTIRCHQGSVSEQFPDLGREYNSRFYNISFFYPEEWFLFESPYYVPFPQYKGIRDEKAGSLLALCSDQNIRVTIQWMPLETSHKQDAFMGLDLETVENLNSVVESIKDIKSHQNHGLEGFDLEGIRILRIWGECQFLQAENESEREFYTANGIYQVARWNLPLQKKTVTLVLISKQYRYGMKVSSPTRHFQDRILADLVRKIELKT
jgi:hypothetical protein